MLIFNILVSLLFSFNLNTEENPLIRIGDVTLYSLNDGYSVSLVAENNTKFDQSLYIDISYTGLRSSMTLMDEVNSLNFVLKPHESKKLKLTRCTCCKLLIQHTYVSRVGSYKNSDHDDQYIYSLPFNNDTNLNLIENRDIVQKENHVIDFLIENGTDIYPARNGLVVEIEDKFNYGCEDESCNYYNNYVLILHEDGTIAKYSNLMFNSITVEPGDQVEKNQVIAKSGSTGRSTFPHLEFKVYELKYKYNKNVDCQFDYSYLRFNNLY